MGNPTRWMFLGCFLALAAIWCLIAGSGNLLFGALGFYILPILAVIAFGVGFTGGDNTESTKNTDVPRDTENKESSL